MGNLPSLLEIQPDNKILEAATLFWDNDGSVFRFGDLEMKPLLEEIGGLTVIPWETPGFLMQENRKGRGFLKIMGLKKSPDLTCLKDSYIPFDYLYERYGHSKSYRTYLDEFPLTSLGHIHKRVFVFMFCFLGMIVFHMKKARIHTRLVMVTKTIMEGIGGLPFSIIPMIVADIYRALKNCQTGASHFEGCNLLLQLWLIEHLQRGQYCQELPRRPWNDHIAFHHPKRMNYIPNMFAQLEDAKGWVELFENLREDKVQWMFEWFPTREFIIRSRDAPFLVLIGLRGTYPYVPLRVMRQAQRKQVITKVEKMSHFRTDFQDDDSPYKCQSQHMWNCKITLEKDSIELDRYHVGYTPYYPVWLEEDHRRLGQPGSVRGHRVIDEKAEIQFKYNQLRKRIRECKNEHQEIQEAHQKLIEKWKDMAISANKRLGYLERGLVKMKTKFIQRIENCQNVEENEGGHLDRAYLLLGLRELVKLFDEAKDAESGQVLLGPSS